MVNQYNSWEGTEMSRISDIGLRTSLPTGQAVNLFVAEYWGTGQEANNHSVDNVF
ncbi:hypothetical protein [Aquiflexum lacus]|uniref:hypothetical protein n=1 Tax=Aquiflexum lacus TaxID=2483805 RepID=UPI001894E4F9|nr:hypothetical protein [Aquiflexum lacus]